MRKHRRRSENGHGKAEANGGLTQQQDLDRLVFASISFPVELFIDSIGPLLRLLLRPQPVLLVVVRFVWRGGEDVGERIIQGGPLGGEHPRRRPGCLEEGGWREERLIGNGTGDRGPIKHSRNIRNGDANRR